jgi:formate hydrogenlyase subunit 3/multisubunit Na+/H+ antiporter MnhD subunit
MTLLLTSLLLPLAGGLLAMAAGRNARFATLFGGGGAISGALLGVAAAGAGLLAGAPLSLSLTWSVPAGSFALHLDSLAAFFLLPIFLLGGVCALYGSAYMRGVAGARRLGPHWLCFNILLVSMALVVTAANAVLFLAAWEIMSLSSFLLVAFEHDRAEVRRAAWIYLLATHLGTAFLFALFLLAGTRTGSFDFASFGALSALPPASAALLFLFAVVGFGTKAGLFPLHVWLPDAHPAAPSHVSALMSGIMIKTGIYGILRMLTFLTPAPAWWGARYQALPGLFDRRKRRHHVSRLRPFDIRLRPRSPRSRRGGAGRRASPPLESRPVQGAAVSRRRLPDARDRQPRSGPDGGAAAAHAVHRRVAGRRQPGHFRTPSSERLRR